jgi:hypothetical protein
MKQNKLSSIKFIGIDPGKGGGVCVIHDDFVEAKKCPSSVHDMSLMFALIIQETPPYLIRVMIEKVWARPHDGRSSVFTFAENYGQWEGIVASHEIELNYVTPQAWMKSYDVPKKLSKTDRKNYIKGLAKKMYPELGKKIILATADAIIIADYGKKTFDKVN